MNNYKHFIAGVTNVVLGTVHIITVEEDGIKPQVSSFVKLINAVKYEDGSYHAYYGDMKTVMKKFFIYWRETMDEAMKRADYFCNQPVNKGDMVLHIVNTIRLWNEYQKKFYQNFLPIESTQQQKINDDLKRKFKQHITELNKTKIRVEKMDQQSDINAFAKDQYLKSVDSKSKVFLYAHSYLSLLLADHLPEIGGSLKEILNRLRQNLNQLEDERESNLTDLLEQLFEKQKEQLLCQKRGSYSGMLELNASINKIRSQVVNTGNHEAVWRVREDIELYERRYFDFERIAITLNTLKAEMEHAYREERVYYSRVTTELPGSKFLCWRDMGIHFGERKKQLKQQLIESAKTLATFFAVRSEVDNVMTYENNVGLYSIDFYGHQIYHFGYGLDRAHVDCNGKFKTIDHTKPDYQDFIGRYFLENEEKVYQVADCTSLYNLGKDTVLEKVTVDCGHSEVAKKECGMTIKDDSVEEMLPKTEPVDIKRTLNSEVVKYLWNAFGGILPDALHDVCQLRPKNPIHCLAHCLLKHKYSRTPAELFEKKLEAEEYRANILKERKESAIAASKAWKAKQVKRRKPEESDDSFNRAVYDIHIATNQFIMSLDYYND